MEGYPTEDEGEGMDAQTAQLHSSYSEDDISLNSSQSGENLNIFSVARGAPSPNSGNSNNGNPALTLPSMNGEASPSPSPARRLSPVGPLRGSYGRSMRRAISVPNLDAHPPEDASETGSGSDVDIDEITHKKRNRTTPEQLAILEEVFSKNTTPNAQIRDALAVKLDMSTRSVQIWFQNRRAKMKLQDKKNIIKTEQAMLAMSYPFGMSNGGNLMRMGSGNSTNGGAGLTGLVMPYYDPLLMGAPVSPNSSTGLSPSPYSNSYNAMSGMSADGTRMRSASTSGISLARSSSSGSISMTPSSPQLSPQLSPSPSLSSSSGNILGGGSSTPNPAMRAIFEADRLKIGTWTRLTMSHGDLVCKFDGTLRVMAWEIVEGPHRCKIEFPFNHVSSLLLHIVNETVAILNLQLLRLPFFYLEVKLSDNRSVWRACNDITEGQQASKESRHLIQASKAILTKQLPRLIENDPYLRTISRVKDETAVAGLHRALLQDINPSMPTTSVTTKSMRKSQSTPVLNKTMPLSGILSPESPESTIDTQPNIEFNMSSGMDFLASPLSIPDYDMHSNNNHFDYVSIKPGTPVALDLVQFPDISHAGLEDLSVTLETLPNSSIPLDLPDLNDPANFRFDADIFIPRTNTL